MKQKTLRYYAAALTGIITFYAAAAAQWIWTQKPIEDVIFVAIMAAMVGTGIFMMASEPKDKRKRRRR